MMAMAAQFERRARSWDWHGSQPRRYEFLPETTRRNDRDISSGDIVEFVIRCSRGAAQRSSVQQLGDSQGPDAKSRRCARHPWSPR